MWEVIILCYAVFHVVAFAILVINIDRIADWIMEDKRENNN